MRCLLLSLLSLALLGSATAIRAGEFTSPKGFTITYPEGWQAVAQDKLDEIAKKATGPKLSALVAGLHRDKITDNMNVIVSPKVQEVNASVVRKTADELQRSSAQNQVLMANLKVQQISVAGNKALSVSFETKPAGSDDMIRVWKIHIPAKTQTYILSCEALKSRWDDELPGFKEMIKDIKVDVGR